MKETNNIKNTKNDGDKIHLEVIPPGTEVVMTLTIKTVFKDGHIDRIIYDEDKEVFRMSGNKAKSKHILERFLDWAYSDWISGSEFEN